MGWTLAVLALSPTQLAFALDPPAVVAVVVDTSGSLRPQDMAGIRELTLGVLGRLDPRSEVAIFSFDDESQLVLPRTSSPEAVQQALEKIQRRGRHTALYDAIYDASRYLRDGPGTRKAILLLTDGVNENSALTFEDGVKLAQEAGIPVFAVGVGWPDEGTLRRIAKLTGGRYTRDKQAASADLAEHIASIATTPVAAPPSVPATPAPSVVAEAPPALEPPAPAPTAPAVREAAPPAVTVAPAPVAAASPKPTGPAPSVPPTAPRGRWVFATVVIALLATGAFYVFRPGSTMRPCPTCGHELPNALSTCSFCAMAEEPRGTDITERNVSPTLSPTLLSPLNNLTEEDLEKTVTLRERPLLHATKGPAAGQHFELSSYAATPIGRSRANDIVLQDVAVSSRHCHIRPEDGRYILHDLQSTNGTFVNERRVTRHELVDGDVLRVGESQLEFKREHRRD